MELEHINTTLNKPLRSNRHWSKSTYGFPIWLHPENRRQLIDGNVSNPITIKLNVNGEKLMDQLQAMQEAIYAACGVPESLIGEPEPLPVDYFLAKLKGLADWSKWQIDVNVSSYKTFCRRFDGCKVPYSSGYRNHRQSFEIWWQYNKFQYVDN